MVSLILPRIERLPIAASYSFNERMPKVCHKADGHVAVSRSLVVNFVYERRYVPHLLGITDAVMVY